MRACDACRIRRTKCSGNLPCAACQRSTITCSFQMPLGKRGPKGKTVARLQQSQATTAGTGSVFASAQSSPDPLLSFLEATAQCKDILADPWEPLPGTNLFSADPGPSVPQWMPESTVPHGLGDGLHGTFDAVTCSPSGMICVDAKLLHAKERHESATVLNLLHPVLESCLEQYLDCIHPLNPTLNKDTILARFAGDVHLHDRSFAYLVLNLCCMGKLVPDSGRTTKQQEREDERADDLYTLATGIAAGSKAEQDISLESVACALVVAAYLKARLDLSRHYLKMQEAMALAALVGLDRRGAPQRPFGDDQTRATVLSWKLAIAQRSFALTQGTPVVFASSRAAQIPPTKDSTLERLRPTALLFDAVPASLAGCICGWCDVGRLNQLNLPFADVSRTDEEHAECLLDRESVMAIHQSVDLVLAPTHGGLVSMADYQITKIWLHAKVWMASVSHSLLDFDSVRPELDLYYPLRLVAQLQLIRLTLPLTAFEANGRGLALKMSQTANAAKMVLSVPELSIPADLGSMNELHGITTEMLALGDKLASCVWMRVEKPRGAQG